MKSGFKEALDVGWKNMSLQSIEIDSNGCLAYHGGKVEADVPTATEWSKPVAGKYVDSYKRGGELENPPDHLQHGGTPARVALNVFSMARSWPS